MSTEARSPVTELPTRLERPTEDGEGRVMHLVLADGTRVSGRGFGAVKEVRGEVVFNTGMTGYVETLTDPSYRGQILVMTYPLQGNYGVPEGPFESGRIQVSGLVVSRYTPGYSHHAAAESLSEWLREHGVPAVEGVDTRTLTRYLREHGTIPGCLLFDESDHDAGARRVEGVEMKRVAELVAGNEIRRYPGAGPELLVIDTGAKENIIRSLQKRGATVIRAPFHMAWEKHLEEIDGVVFTNGPGDPKDLGAFIERVRGALSRGLPTFGVCLGHQILSLAAGAETYKMKYGHRSVNQPVLDLVTRRAYVTSQNHGYALDSATLPADWEPWFVNLNDGTNEGIRHRFRPFWAVQFHPEASPGPQDTAFLFDDFLRAVRSLRAGRRT